MKAMWAFVTAACATMTMMTIAAGCGRPQSKPAGPISVATEDGSPFPGRLSGRWTSDRHGWEFVIEPDGRISSAILSFGRTRVLPGQTTTLTTKTGEQAVLTPGPWTVHYDPAANMLTLKIAMDHIHFPMTPNLLEGSSNDVLSGVVSPSMDTWQVQWTTFTAYTVRTADGKSTDLSTDKTYGETQSLVFTKTESLDGQNR
jgi:hypothetical protein